MARSLIRPDAAELRRRPAAAPGPQPGPGTPALGALTHDDQAWWDGKEWKLILGIESADGSSWWDGKRWKATYWKLPKSYLWVLLPINLVVIGIVFAAIVRAFQGQVLPDAIIAIGSTAIGGLIGLLIPSPAGSSAPSGKDAHGPPEAKGVV